MDLPHFFSFSLGNKQVDNIQYLNLGNFLIRYEGFSQCCLWLPPKYAKYGNGEIVNKKYLLLSFDDGVHILMIDSENYYLSGFMVKEGDEFKGLYILNKDGDDCIRHSRYQSLCLWSWREFLGNLKLEANQKDIYCTLDKLSYLVCEPLRFQLIRHYIASKSMLKNKNLQNFDTDDFKSLVTNWKKCYGGRIMQKSIETLKTMKEKNHTEDNIYKYYLYKLK